jgi:hypothetical protein
MWFRVVHAAVVLTTVAWSCSTLTGPPSGGIVIKLDVNSTVGSPGHGITAKAMVTNQGTLPIRYVTGCNAGPAIRIVVLAEGETQPFDPCNCPTPCVTPACADQVLSLVRGRSVEGSMVFDGTRYNCDGAFAAPAGHYTVVATFVGKDHDSHPITLTETKSFDWSTH